MVVGDRSKGERRRDRVGRLRPLVAAARGGEGGRPGLSPELRSWCVSALTEAVSRPDLLEDYRGDVGAAWEEVGGPAVLWERECPDLPDDLVASSGFNALSDDCLAYVAVSPDALEVLYNDLHERIAGSSPEQPAVGDWFYDEVLSGPEPTAEEGAAISAAFDRLRPRLAAHAPPTPLSASHSPPGPAGSRAVVGTPPWWLPALTAAAASLFLGVLLGSVGERWQRSGAVAVVDTLSPPTPQVFGPLPAAPAAPDRPFLAPEGGFPPSAPAPFAASAPAPAPAAPPLLPPSAFPGPLRVRFDKGAEGRVELLVESPAPVITDEFPSFGGRRFLTIVYVTEDGREEIVPGPDQNEVSVRVGEKRSLGVVPEAAAEVYVIATDAAVTDAFRKSLRQVTVGRSDPELRRRVYRAVMEYLGHADVSILSADPKSAEEPAALPGSEVETPDDTSGPGAPAAPPAPPA